MGALKIQNALFSTDIHDYSQVLNIILFISLSCHYWDIFVYPCTRTNWAIHTKNNTVISHETNTCAKFPANWIIYAIAKASHTHKTEYKAKNLSTSMWGFTDVSAVINVSTENWKCMATAEILSCVSKNFLAFLATTDANLKGSYTLL